MAHLFVPELRADDDGVIHQHARPTAEAAQHVSCRGLTQWAPVLPDAKMLQGLLPRQDLGKAL